MTCIIVELTISWLETPYSPSYHSKQHPRSWKIRSVVIWHFRKGQVNLQNLFQKQGSSLEIRCFGWVYHRLLVSGKKWLEYVKNCKKQRILEFDCDQSETLSQSHRAHSDSFSTAGSYRDRSAQLFAAGHLVISVIWLVWDVGGVVSTPLWYFLKQSLRSRVFAVQLKAADTRILDILRWIFNFFAYVDG